MLSLCNFTGSLCSCPRCLLAQTHVYSLWTKRHFSLIGRVKGPDHTKDKKARYRMNSLLDQFLFPTGFLNRKIFLSFMIHSHFEFCIKWQFRMASWYAHSTLRCQGFWQEVQSSNLYNIQYIGKIMTPDNLKFCQCYRNFYYGTKRHLCNSKTLSCQASKICS